MLEEALLGYNQILWLYLNCMTITNYRHTFCLSNFEGPLDFLLHLIQKSEIDIYEVLIQQITEQYLEAISSLAEQDVDGGAEFLNWATTLILMKSKTLLPPDIVAEVLEGEEEEDPNFEIIHQLIEYCKHKQHAKKLSVMEEERSRYFFRGDDPTTRTFPRPLGLDGLALQDISAVFEECLAKAASRIGADIEEETWKVSDKIKSVRRLLREKGEITFQQLFAPEKSRLELIVIFLALLELMKLGDAETRESASGGFTIYAT